MHRSRFAGLIIDCETEDLETAARFWSAALGCAGKSAGDDTEKLYVELTTRGDQPYIEVQKVAHPSRVHLDIEADDLDAEARRLEALGARRVARVKSWIVMEAPTGQRFCIVPPVSADFTDTANVWQRE